MDVGAFGDGICNKTTEDLAPTIETEPDPCACALFSLGVPLKAGQRGV